ncbi:MAG: TniB family NTP-binding protein [Cyclobacteriaceae bacterium]|nr:TniB family NTP-binding protein [Cyclobacteriaceae bacterium]
MEKQDYLNRETREFLESCVSSADDSRRIRYIRQDKFIEYSAASMVLKEIKFLMESPDVSRTQSLMVKARSQNGKTSIRQRIASLNEPRMDERERIIRTVVSVEMPPDPNYVSLINTILTEMGLPDHHSKRSDVLLRHLVYHLSEYQVRAIILDEIHIMGRAQDRPLRHLLDTIKAIVNMAKIPLIAFGTVDAAIILEKDEQMHSRFTQMDLPDWTGNEDLQTLFKSFEEGLPLRKQSNLTDDELGFHLFDKTNGTIGELNRLLQQCAIEAIKSGEERITVNQVKMMTFHSSKPKRVQQS